MKVNNTMIAIASDHAGYELKRVIIEYLNSKGLEYHDYGAYSLESVDYPIYARLAAGAVASGTAERGILVCGTGIGMAIAANKLSGIRCAQCDGVLQAERSRSHNDANMIALGELIVDAEQAIQILDIWLNTEFEQGRHARRVALIEATDEKE